MSVTSTPKGSDLELDDRKAIERAVKDAFSRLLAGEYDPALQGYEYRTANREAALNAATDQLLSLISAARKGQGEWSGIESAPKDGTEFLIALSDGGVEKARYGQRFGSTGWLIARIEPGGPVFLDHHATHWMSLPLPPPSKQEE